MITDGHGPLRIRVHSGRQAESADPPLTSLSRHPTADLRSRPRSGGGHLVATYRGGLANLAVTGLDQLVRVVRVVKRGLKKIQYRPHLIDGCLAETDLVLMPL
ncbi:hypothetical protein GCM10023075_72040 [Streptosporangium album]